MSHLWSNECLTLWKLLSPKAAGSVESETKQQRNKLIIPNLKIFQTNKISDTAHFCYRKEIIRLQELQHRTKPLLSKFWASKLLQGRVQCL